MKRYVFSSIDSQKFLCHLATEGVQGGLIFCWGPSSRNVLTSMLVSRGTHRRPLCCVVFQESCMATYSAPNCIHLCKSPCVLWQTSNYWADSALYQTMPGSLKLEAHRNKFWLSAQSTNLVLGARWLKCLLGSTLKPEPQQPSTLNPNTPTTLNPKPSAPTANSAYLRTGLDL